MKPKVSFTDPIDKETEEIAKDLMEFEGMEFKKAYLRIRYRKPYNRMAVIFEKLEEFGFENKNKSIVVPLKES